MDNDIKVGDTVEHPGYPDRPPATVIWVHDGELWLLTQGGWTEVCWVGDWRKVKTPTLCPEGWANVYPKWVGSWFPTRERAEQDHHISRPARIGVIHLSPNGDCEFIRTEEP